MKLITLIVGDSQALFLSRIFKNTDSFTKEFIEAEYNPSGYGSGSDIFNYHDAEVVFVWKIGKQGATLNRPYFLNLIDESIPNGSKPDKIIFVLGTADVIILMNKSLQNMDIVEHTKDVVDGYVRSILEITKKYNAEPFIVLPIMPVGQATRDMVNDLFKQVLIQELTNNQILNVIDVLDVIPKDFKQEKLVGIDNADHHPNKENAGKALEYIWSKISGNQEEAS